MNLKYYSTRNLNKQIRGIIKKYLDMKKYRVFFFGSRVRGDNFERADIDIGIKGPQKIPSAIKLQIQEELDNLPILYKIDLVDFCGVPQDFKKQAIKHIEYVT